MHHKYKTASFLSFAYNRFLKIVIDLEFLIPTLRLFHSFIQYGKNVHLFIQYGKNMHLKDFVPVGSGLTIEVDDDLSK